MNAIFEKIITAYVSDYIKNYDKNKFSKGLNDGKLIIDDIYIDCNQLNKFKFPFKFKYAKIGKINILVPWNNFNDPTIIEIENVQILITTVNQEDWEFPEYFEYKTKVDLLVKFANDILSTFEEKYSKSNAQKSLSMTEGIIIKILNKLKITMKNFHFRFEEYENLKDPISIGITLKEFSFLNANAKFEEITDKNKQSMSEKNVFKLLKVETCGIYFKNSENLVISRFDGDNIISETMDKLYNSCNPEILEEYYIISPSKIILKLVNLSLKLKTNDYTSLFDNSLWNIWLSVDVENLDIEVTKKNFNSFVLLTNLFTNYIRFRINYLDTFKFNFFKPKYRVLDNQALSIFKDSQSIKRTNAIWWWKYSIRMVTKRIKFIRGSLNEFDLPEILMNEWQKEFDSLFTKYFTSPSSLVLEEINNLQKIVTKVDISILYEWVRKSIKNINLTKQQEKKDSDQKGLMGGFFGMFGKKPEKQQVLLTEDEIKKINSTLKESIKLHNFREKQGIFKIIFSFHFQINSGSLKLLEKPESNTIITEGIQIQFNEFKLGLDNDNNKISFENQIKSFDINLFSIIKEEKSYIPITIRENHTENFNYFETKLELDEFFNSNLYIKINTFHLMYTQQYFNLLQSFIDIDFNDHFIHYSVDSWEKLKSKASSSINSALTRKNVVNIMIEPRKFLIPLNKHDVQKSQFLCLDSGNILMKNIEGEEKYTQKFEFNYNSLKFLQFETFEDFKHNLVKQQIFAQLGFSFYFSILTTIEDDINLPRFKLDLDLEKININLTKKIFTLLLLLPETLKSENVISKFSFLFNDKTNKEHEIKTHGKVLKRNEILNTWDEYYGVLSGGYLYFFEKLEDQKYSVFYNLNDAELIEEEELQNNLDNKLRYFVLSNKENTIELMFPNNKKEITWINALKESIYEMKTNYEKENNLLRKDSRKEYSEDMIFGANIKLGEIEINLIDDLNNNEFTLSLSDICFKVLSKSKDYEAKFIIGNLKLDAINNFIDRKCIIYSSKLENTLLENSNLIIIYISYISSKSKKYNNVNFDINATLGNIICYWHPTILGNLINYFMYTNKERITIIKGETFNDYEDYNDKIETCLDKKSIILRINLKLDNLNMICIHKKLCILFTEFYLNQAQIGVDYFVDHLESFSKVSNLKIYDLSNYPYKYDMSDKGSTIIKTKKIIFELNENSPLSLSYKLFNNNCPCRDKIYNSHLKLSINSIKLYYYHEHFFRLYDYIFDDILATVNPSSEVKKYLKSSSSLLKNNNDANFTKMEISIDNPKLILKTRPHNDLFFMVDLGNIKMKNSYKLEQGRIRNNKDMNSWVSYFDLFVKEFNVTREDNFQIISPTEMKITFNTLMLGEEEKMISLIDLDKSLNFSLYFSSINLNGRQRDFNFLMKFLNLNINYEDEQKQFYKNNDDSLFKYDNAYSSQYDSLYLKNIFIEVKEITVTLFLQKPFCQLNLNNCKAEIHQSVSLRSDTEIFVQDYSIYQILDDKFTKMIIETTMIDNDINMIELLDKRNIKIIVHYRPNVDITTLINLVQLKLMIRNDLFLLVKDFFYNGLPVYDPKSTDLPNEYDINRDNPYQLKFNLEIEEFLITLLTDSIENKNQEVLCLYSNFNINFNKEKMKVVKQQSESLFKDRLMIAQLAQLEEEKIRANKNLENCKVNLVKTNINFGRIKAFALNINNLNKSKLIPSRLIFKEDNINMEYNINLKYIMDNTYLLSSEILIDLKEIDFRVTYRDLVSVLKSLQYNYILQTTNYEKNKDFLINEENYNLANNQIHINEHPEKNGILIKNTSLNQIQTIGETITDNVIENNFSTCEIIVSKVKIILVDDHSNTYYPFFKLSSKEMVLNIETSSKLMLFAKLEFGLKLSSYNYIAEIWEPLFERNEVVFSYISDKSDPFAPNHTIEISIPSNKNDFIGASNINVSDMSIALLYSTLRLWIEKFYKFQNNESLGQDTFFEENMKFSNHKIINYTGKNIIIYKVFFGEENHNNYKQIIHITNLYPGQSYDLEVDDESTLKINKRNNLETSVFFELEDIKKDKISDNLIKINEVQLKTHKIDYSKYKNSKSFPKSCSQYECIYSQVKYDNIKKEILFYSPVVIENQTNYTFQIKLFKEYNQDLYIFLEPNNQYGVPFEYFDGIMEISINDSDPVRFQCIKLFNMKNDHIEVIQNRGMLILNIFVNEFEKNYENFKIITINTSYKVRNCLPYEIELITLTNDKTEKIKLEKNQTLSFDNISLKEDLIVYLKFLNFFSSREIILCKAKKPNKSTQFEVCDSINSTILTLYTMVVEEKGCRIIVIYSNGVIIDNTLLNLSFYYTKEEKSRIRSSNDGNIFLFNNTDNIIVRTENLYSKPYSIKGIGLNTLIEMKNNRYNYQCSMQSSFCLVAKDLEIYSLVLTFNPLFIIENTLKCNILICMKDSDSVIDLYSSGERRPFYFMGNDYEKKISFRPVEVGNDLKDDISVWKWSEGIIISNKTLTTVLIEGKNPAVKKFINVCKRVENNINLISLEETDFDNCEFTIQNETHNFLAQVYQYGFKENFSEIVNIKSKSIFAFFKPSGNNSIELSLMNEDISSHPIQYQNSIFKIDFFEEKVILNNQEEIFYPVTKKIKLKKISSNESDTITLKIITCGTRRKIILNDMINDEVNKNLVWLHTVLNIKVDRLGICFISDNRHIAVRNIKSYRRFEIFYILFKEIIYYSKYQEIEGSYKAENQFMIKSLQIDNQFNKITKYPVVLRPLIMKTSENLLEIPPLFNLAIYFEKNKEDNFIKISLLNFLIQSVVVGIDTDIIDCIIDYVSGISSQIKKPFLTVSPVFTNEEQTNNPNRCKITNNFIEPEWINYSIVSSSLSPKISIQHLITSPLEINLSVATKGKSNNFAKIVFNNKVLSTILTNFSDMENVELTIAGSELSNLYTDKNQLIDLIFTAYKQSLLHQIMKCIGSIDLLGNPVNLMKNIGTGFKDLFVKPANGFVRGPLQGFKGIIMGGSSLTQKTVGGVFDTASKLTGGISKGLLTLTTDDKYIKKREDNKVSMKPGNVVTGVGYGMFSLFSGIFHGVTGVVTKPIEAAKEGNIGKGFLQGFTGLVVKPISGVFDLVSKTTEGMKNNISSKNIVEKNRPLRAFYGKYLIFKDFNRFHSDIYMILNDVLEYSYADFCDAVIYHNKSNEYSLLIVNKSEIIFYDLVKNKMKVKLYFSDITNVSIEGGSVKILCLDKNRKLVSWVLDLLEPTKSNLSTIYNLINRYWRNYNTELLL